jgi:hypothetical protein
VGVSQREASHHMVTHSSQKLPKRVGSTFLGDSPAWVTLTSDIKNCTVYIKK